MSNIITMWQKITSLDQLLDIDEGSIVAIYPLGGHPRDSFDRSEAGLFLHGLIVENDRMMQKVDLSLLNGMPTSADMCVDEHGEMMINSTSKTYTEVVSEGLWWMLC